MRDARRQTPLHTAARAGNTRAVLALLEAVAQPGAFPSAARAPYHELLDRWHRSALHWAVVNGWLETAKALIDAGAAVNGVRSPVTGKQMPLGKHLKGTSLPMECPLHSAARLPPAKAKPMIRLLLAARADPTVKDQFGRTAIELLEPSVATEMCVCVRS
jgi:ankyrin repeat protein